MAELTTTETTASSCCAPEAQATCCEPSAKAECCHPSHREDCECSAGKGADFPDIRERARERYAAVAVQAYRTNLPDRKGLEKGSRPRLGSSTSMPATASSSPNPTLTS